MTINSINNLPLDVLCNIVTESKNPECFKISKLWNENVKNKWIEQYSILFKDKKRFFQLNEIEQFYTLKNIIFDGIHHQHFQEIIDLENRIPPSEEIKLDQLIKEFRQNADWTTENMQQSVEQILTSLKQEFNQIQNRSNAIDIPKNTEEKETYYMHLEMLLKNIFVQLNQEQIQARSSQNVLNTSPLQILLQIQGVNNRHCQILAKLERSITHPHASATHWMNAVIECYAELLYNSGDSFENQLKQKLHMVRREILADIVLEIETKTKDTKPFRTHNYLNLIRKIGEMRGIFGGIFAKYNDSYSRNIDIATAYHKFDSKYTRDDIIMYVKSMVDGNSHKQACIQWFKDHIPNTWKDCPLKNNYTSHEEQFLYEFVIDSNYNIQVEAIVYMLKEMHILF